MTMNNPATTDLDLAGFRARNAGASMADGDYIRRGELSALILAAAANGVMLRRDGQNSPTTDIPFANWTLTGIRNAVAAQEPVAKSQMDAAIAGVLASLPGLLRSTVTGNLGTLTFSRTTPGAYSVSLTPGIYCIFRVNGGQSGESGVPDGGSTTQITTQNNGTPTTLYLYPNSESLAATYFSVETLRSWLFPPALGGAPRNTGNLYWREGGGGAGGTIIPDLTNPTPDPGNPAPGAAQANGVTTKTPYTRSPGVPGLQNGGSGNPAGGSGGNGLGEMGPGNPNPLTGKGGGFGHGGGGGCLLNPSGSWAVGCRGGNSGESEVLLIRVRETTTISGSVGAGGAAIPTVAGVVTQASGGGDGAIAIFPVT